MRVKSLVAAMLLAGAATMASAAEFPLGKPLNAGGMEINTVYLQPITMEPAGMMRDAAKSDIHLEADIHAIKNNPNGYAEGDWIPGLEITYKLQKMKSDGKTPDGAAIDGLMMPMVASDGPHYGDNVKLAGVGKYKLTMVVNAPGTLQDYAQPAHFLPETLSGLELLGQLRIGSGRFVFVVDEYGVVQGTMTPRDLLEAITGELLPGSDDDTWATLREDGSWLLDGQMPVSELKARLDIRDLPGEDRGRYNTVAGLLLSVSGHLPAVGERIPCAGWVFEVVDLDGRRIDKVWAQPDNPQPVSEM